jgi:bifunctional UDP-N-acetylglucosamine pyrophosphorylase/glucosamine-1-phosphate N-acetyltransferase
MQAVIMAAGKGTRIFPLSLIIPKPLIKVANKTILEHNLDNLIGIVDEVIIIVNYKKEKIIDFFGNYYKGMNLKYAIQKETKGTANALNAAKDFIKSDFLVVSGDDLYSRKDIEQLTKYKNALSVQYKQDPSTFGVIEFDKNNNNQVLNVVEKPDTFVSNYVNIGLYKLTKEIFPILENLTLSKRGEYELTDALKILAINNQLTAHIVTGYWIPIGYPWQILEASKYLLENKKENIIKGKINKTVQITGNLSLGHNSSINNDVILDGNILIGNNCTIENNVFIKGNCSIANNSKISKGTIITNSSIGSNVKIEENCHIHDSVIGDNSHILSNIKTHNTNGGETIKIHSNGKIFDSKKEKLGAFISANSKVENNLESGECYCKDKITKK